MEKQAQESKLRISTLESGEKSVQKEVKRVQSEVQSDEVDIKSIVEDRKVTA